MLQFQPLEAELERFGAEVIPRVRALPCPLPEPSPTQGVPPMSVPAPPVTELWYTRCPVPTASSLAITQGWLDEEFAPDGITVASLRSAPTARCASRTSTTRRRTRSARAATSRRSGPARGAPTCA